MSFNDLNDLESQSDSYSNQPLASPEFTRLTKSISQKIFTMTSNIALVHRYIGLLGTHRDTERMRSSLMDTLAKTKNMSKDMVPDIRTLNRWDPDEIGPNGKYSQQKLTADFQKAVTDFQNAQKLALEKQKDYVKEVRAAMEEENAEFEDSPDGRGRRVRHPPQKHQNEQIQLLDNSEVEFNEHLIEEREQEIQGIEQGIVELNEIFRDLGTIVAEQGSLLGSFRSIFSN
jgi:t-SNARE complex subunit (syntaxin)